MILSLMNRLNSIASELTALFLIATRITLLLSQGMIFINPFLKKIDNESKTDYEASDLEIDIKYMTMYMDSIKYFNRQLDSIENTFKPQFIGYRITHTYRAKNKMNALVLEEKEFLLDSTLKVK